MMTHTAKGLGIFLAFTALLTLGILNETFANPPGVKVGYWIEYGDFVGSGLSAPSYQDFNDTQTMRVEVIGVEGDQVNVRVLRTYKNGTKTQGAELQYNVETGQVDAAYYPDAAYYGQLVIGTNLNANDVVFPSSAVDTTRVNFTESRQVLNDSRIVNILEFTSRARYGETGWNNESKNYVYDQSTGFLLEYNYTLSTGLPLGDELLCFKANRISTTPASFDMNLVYIATGGAAVAVAALALVLIRRRRRGR